MKKLIFLLVLISLLPFVLAYDIEDIVNQGETETYIINNRSYSVTVNFVSEDSVRITYNGEPSEKLERRDNPKFSDGTSIVIQEILYQPFAGGIQAAQIGMFLGKGMPVEVQELPEVEEPAEEQVEEVLPPIEELPAEPAPEPKKSFFQLIIEFFQNLFR